MRGGRAPQGTAARLARPQTSDSAVTLVKDGDHRERPKAERSRIVGQIQIGPREGFPVALGAVAFDAGVG